MSIEQKRLDESGNAWRHWGPYLSERAWGTVREDYSADGSAWDYFPHDAARSRVYRWNEDGLAGISDDRGRLCLALALWNGQDPILKERLFGLTGPQGNHGEDVKEYYFYLDSTPTHSYMRMLYKYPQTAFPYQQLNQENARRSRQDEEYELFDTGVFNNNRYFDIFIEYAKSAPEDVLMKVTAVNRGSRTAPLWLLPTLWFRNTWSWGLDERRPQIQPGESAGSTSRLVARHHIMGEYSLFCEDADELLFTHNETNIQKLYGGDNSTPYVKDAFHRYLVGGEKEAVNPEQTGTKAAALYHRLVEPGQSVSLRLRLVLTEANTPAKGQDVEPTHPVSHARKAAYQPAYRLPMPTYYAGFVPPATSHDFNNFDEVLKTSHHQADEFYAELQPAGLSADLCLIHRQALAGMLWSKQFYHFEIDRWLKGDPAQPAPPPERLKGRNSQWKNIYNERVMSMPDKWEYPWYAAWDLAFHCVPLALVDIDFAKSQLDLLVREWYQHPNGQIPAYEWAFGDVNPPVFAWAAWRVYKMEQKRHQRGDKHFLESLFHKLLLNFNWWVNRKDSEGNNVFQGGFLGLDNIGVFDRSAPLPTGGSIEQSDGTSWMGMFALNMMKIALELALDDPVYEDIATKFFEHFLAIAAAMNNIADEGLSLWDRQDEFFYDVLRLPDGTHRPLKVRSLVGLIPLLAVDTIEPDTLARLPGFKERLEWFLNHRPDLTVLVSHWQDSNANAGERRLLTLVRGSRLKRLLRRMLNPDEFLSEFGVRSLSKYHQLYPYVLKVNGMDYTVRYEPAESRSGLFGGNSNWRGPIWFPINYLLIESLQKFYHYYGDDFRLECPTGSENYLTLNEIADELSQRMIKLFTRDSKGKRAFFGKNETMQHDPYWRDYILFYEFFHGDNGTGLGASHQTGWTGLVAKLVEQQGEKAHQSGASLEKSLKHYTIPD